MIRPTEIEMWEVELPLRRPLASAAGRFTVRRATVIRMVNGGLEGWGEAATYPRHTRDDPEEAWQLVSTEARRLLGADDPVVIEGSAASAGIDQAMTALQAAAAADSLSVFLGGDHDPVPASVAIPIGDTPDVISGVAAAADRGYRHVKLKIAPGCVGMVAAVRAEFPDLGVAVDGNGSFTRTGLEELLDLDRLGLDYIEQPLGIPHLQAHAELQNRLTTPICLDESVRRLGDVVTIATAAAARAVALKPGRLGPNLTARALMLATRHGLEAKIGGLVETGVGKHTAVALATLSGVSLPSDLTESAYFFEHDLVTPPWELNEHGMLQPRSHLIVDRNAVQRAAVRHHRFHR